MRTLTILMLFLCLSQVRGAQDDSALKKAVADFEIKKRAMAFGVIGEYQKEIDQLKIEGKKREADLLTKEMEQFAINNDVVDYVAGFNFGQDIKRYLDRYAKAGDLDTDVLRDEKRKEVASEMLERFNKKEFSYRVPITDISQVDAKKFEFRIERDSKVELPFFAAQVVESVVLEMRETQAKKFQKGDFIEIAGKIDLQDTGIIRRQGFSYQNEKRKACYPVVYLKLPQNSESANSGNSGFGGGFGGGGSYLQISLYDIETKAAFKN